jgi:trk system potassium uptake protein TrkH
MTGFEAVIHAMTSLSTGGYSTSDSSFGHFQSPFLHWAGTIFMLAGALPFVWYVRILRKRRFRSEQVVGLVTTLSAIIASLTLWRVMTSDTTFFKSLTDTAFSVVSVVTTTGYATSDYTTWGPFAVAAFLIITALGGCTGSTAGGIKMMRLIILFHIVRARISVIHYPSRVAVIRYEDKAVTADQIDGIIAFCVFFFLTFAGGTIALALIGLDASTAVSGSLTALCNVGPGVGTIIGPAGNFSTLPDSAKWVLSFLMYAGRLELLTVYVLFLPSFWREAT